MRWYQKALAFVVMLYHVVVTLLHSLAPQLATVCPIHEAAKFIK